MKDSKNLEEFSEIVFFDFDGTVVSSDMHEAIWWMIDKLPNSFQRISKKFLFIILFPVLIFLHFFLNEDYVIRFLVWLAFTDVLESDFIKSREYIFQKFDKSLREELVEEIKKHLSEGKPVYVLSGNILPLIEPYCKKKLGVTGVVATELVIENTPNGNRFVGKTIYRPCVLEEKVSRFKEIINRNGSSNSKVKVHYYGNSRSDIPCLNAADFPYPVTPDRTLLRHSLSKNWTQEFFHLKKN